MITKKWLENNGACKEFINEWGNLKLPQELSLYDTVDLLRNKKEYIKKKYKMDSLVIVGWILNRIIDNRDNLLEMMQARDLQGRLFVVAAMGKW